MKQYTAVYKENRRGDLHSLKSEYSSKANFARDLRKNGLIPVAILTDNQIEAIKKSDITIMNKFLNLDFEYVKQCL